MNWKKSADALLFFAFFSVFTAATTFAQAQRPRIVQTEINQPPKTQTPPRPSETLSAQNKTTSYNRPVLTNRIIVAPLNSNPVPLVKKTALSAPSAPAANALAGQALAAFNARLNVAMNARLGIRYVYGSDGPGSYDCSGLIWSVFRDAGFSFERTSARSLWTNFEPVYGDERFKFGTLVFFNSLGHVGIVVDDKGFYHASSSKGVTYSPFAGYWGKRVVGFRRAPLKQF